MRVTAGRFKGRTLIDRPLEHIRPTADMVKQAIFNKLQFELPQAKVLDLFCGTGALGIEALSRGAKEVVFADLDARSTKLTKNNLSKLGNPPEARVLNGDYAATIEKLAGQKFDIIILDPPYKSGVYEDCLKRLFDKKLLADDGVIVCEQEKTIDIDFSLFDLVDQKIYGIKKVSYLKNAR